jgi:hypothetical protein
MNKEYFTKLTSRLYRLSLFFPQDDPLRVKVRKLGADILANLIFILEGAFYQSRDLICDVQRDIEALNSFFGVIKTLDWVNSSDLLEIQKEYSKIGIELKKISEIQSLKVSEIHALQLEGERKKLPQQKVLLDKKETKEEEVKEDEGIELSQFERKDPEEESPEAEKLTRNNDLLGRQQKILEILKEKGKAQVKDFKEVFPETSKRTLRRDFRRLMDQNLVERIGERNDTFYQFNNRQEG